MAPVAGTAVELIAGARCVTGATYFSSLDAVCGRLPCRSLPMSHALLRIRRASAVPSEVLRSLAANDALEDRRTLHGPRLVRGSGQVQRRKSGAGSTCSTDSLGVRPR